MQEKAPRKRKKRRMRLPNGLGSVHQIGDGKSRRNPWRARVPSHIEFNASTGKATQKYITLGYYATETEAIEALFEYRKSPFTMDAAETTFAELFEMWKAKKFPEVSTSSQRGYSAAFKSSAPLHDMKVRDIRAQHLENVMQNVVGGYQVQVRMKTMWGQLFKYAMEHDIIQKDYSDFVKTRDKMPETKRNAIPAEHRALLWQAAQQGDEIAQIAMIYIYTGMRASELLEIKKENVDIENRIMVGGLKTAAGIDRRIPIHRAILPFVERFMQTPGELLLMRKDREKPEPFTYARFNIYNWIPLMERMGNWNYTCHYCRHTCATMMREADIADDLRKLILGHANGDITARYTHHADEALVEAIDKIPMPDGL